MGQSILVTGGAGYIGTHTVLQLLLGGYKVVVVHDLDNLSDVALQGLRNSPAIMVPTSSSLRYVNRPLLVNSYLLAELDLCDKRALEEVFSSTNFDSVLHFAGLKVVAGSRIPFYPRNCLIGTYVLLAVMAEHGCKKLVFSSSATFYERCNTHYVEEICRDVYKSDPGWNVIVLRYSNPSGHIGEDPRGIPNSLMTFVQQVVVGRRPTVTVDGVGDYIHVINLADGHIAAVRKLGESDEGCEVYNLSPKNGTLELEMVAKDERPWDEGVDLLKAMIRGHVDGYEYVCEEMGKMEKQVNEKPEYANMVPFKAALDGLKLAFKMHEEAVRKMTQDRVSLGNRRFKNEEEKNEFTALIVENMPVCFHLQRFPAAPLGGPAKKKCKPEVQTSRSAGAD